jgi:5-methylcytosine-specific restriction protein A
VARLKQVKPQVRTLGLAVTMAAPVMRRGSFEDRSFYKTARWQRLRWDVLVRDSFTCQWPGCGRVEADTSLLVADHIEPVRVAPERKWDEANLRCLCKACHDGPRQAQEVAIYGVGAKGRGG